MTWTDPVWTNTNRFSQTGYSAPTIFPELKNYNGDIEAFEEDLKKAQERDESHLDWLQEERREARLDTLRERDEYSCQGDYEYGCCGWGEED
jgi:outer membrane translocation and assembly module TamA